MSRIFVLHALQDREVLVEGTHDSLRSAARVSRTFVDKEVAVLVVFLVELLHVVLPMSILHMLMLGTVLGGIMMSGSMIGVRIVPSMQVTVSGWRLPPNGRKG